jgi:uncharacterized protein (DUF433 family)
MGALFTSKQHVTSTPGVCGGKPCVAGTRIRVQDIVIRTELGDSPDHIIQAYPQLTLADVHAALAYYFDNRELIDQQIREGETLAEQMKQQAGTGLIDQLRKTGTDDASIPPR